MTRDSSRRRASLLATSSFVAASVLGGMGAMSLSLAPSIAMAASECGTAPGILTCNPSGTTYPAGITYTGAKVNSGDTSVLLNSSQVTANGVTLSATTNVALAVDTVMQKVGDPAANVAGTVNNGIFLKSAGGNVTVNTVDTLIGGVTVNDVANTVTGQSGILTRTSGTGKTSITIGADTITGNPGSGIDARTTGTGSTSVSVAKGGAVNTTGFANYDIFIQGAGGAVSLNTDGSDTVGGASVATSINGTVGVTVGVDAVVQDAANIAGAVVDSGLITQAAGGLTTLSISGTVKGTGDGNGITVISGTGGTTINTLATATVSSTNVTGIVIGGTGGAVTGTILGKVTGDYAMTTTQTGLGTINLNYGGTITGTNGGLSQSTQVGTNQANLTGSAVVTATGPGTNAAVNLVSATGTVTVNSTVNTDIESNAAGVNATSTKGNVNVLLDGTIGKTANVGGDGIDATVTGVNGGSIQVTTTNTIKANGIGINATTNGTGSVTVDPTGAIVAGSTGVNAAGKGGPVTVDTTNGGKSLGSNITSTTADGIDASNQGTGGVNVTTGSGTTIKADNGNGIVATENGGSSDVTVTQNGNVGSLGDNVGKSGIIAQNTKAGSTGNVIVNSNAAIFANGLVAGTTYGIKGTTIGNGNVTITATNNKTDAGATFGMFGSAVGGAVKITSNDVITANTGIHADNSGAGTIQVFQTALGSINATTGNGIEANTSGTGSVNVGTATTRITGPITATNAAGNGIQAAGKGVVNVFTGVSNIQGNTNNGFGVIAQVINAPTAGATVLVDAAGSTISGSTGIFAGNNGNGAGNTVTVNTDTATSVTGFKGDAIEAIGAGAGQVTVLNNGTATSTGGKGIDAIAAHAGNTATGNVDVNGSGAILVNIGAGSGAGIFVRSDLGNLTVGDLGGGYSGTIDNKDAANGIDASITNAASSGNISVTTAAGGVIGAGSGDNTVTGILATTVGLGSVTVVDNGNIGSLANNRVSSAGISASIINAANLQNVNVTVGGAVNIDAAGDGVFATTNGLGNVVVTQNLGVGTIDSLAATGILASDTANKGTGTVTVNQNAKVTTHAGTAVTATSNAQGDVTVNQGVGAVISATGGDGIDVNNTSGKNGNVIADLNGSTTATGIGVFATTNTNDDVTVTLETGSHVTGGSAGAANDGVLATDTSGKTGAVNVNMLGTATVGTGPGARTGGNGVEVNSNGPGVLAVTTAATTNIWSVGTGILADENYNVLGKQSADLVITAHGSIDSSNSLGIDAEVTGANNVAAIFVTAGNITSKLDGVLAKTIGGGNVTVTTDAGTAIKSSNANGIEARSLGGNGNVLVTNNGTVTGDPGIIISAVGTGTAEEIANASVTGTLDAVNITSVDGLLTVQVNNNGTVVSSTGSGRGINALTTGNGAISITTAAGTTVEGGTSGIVADGIAAQVDGTGTITVEVAGAVGTKAPINNFGIFATGNGGLVQVTLDPSGSVTDGGISATNTSVNNGNVNVALNGASSVTDTVGDGVFAEVNTGAANVQGAAGSTITATNGDGIDARALVAGGTVVVNDQGSISSSTSVVGTDAIFASTVNGNIIVTTGPGTITGNGGIATSITSGTGTTTIDTGTGLVKGTGVTSTQKDGIHATTGGSGLVKIVTGPVTSVNGNGVFAQSTTGAANIIIDTTLGAINGKTSGITADNSAGAGSILITDAAVTATAGFGINATGGTGGTIVNVNGPVTSTIGQAINATSAGGGKTQVITGALGSIISNSGGGGINATSGTGAVIVTTNNTVTGATNGITTSTGGTGTITIDTTAGGLVKGNAGDGIDATDNSGAILIQTAAVTGTVNGISATANTAPITITTNGAITGGTGSGINAATAGNGKIQINVLTGAVQGAIGISTAQTGTGVTNIVDGLAANTITGTAGDGIQSVNGAGTGAVNVGGGPGSRIEAAVHGTTNGIDISGAGPMNVFTDANVTGDAGWGIKAVSTAAPVVVNVTTGTIQGSATGGKGGGILAKSGAAGANAVTVVSTTKIVGLLAGSNGIDAEDTVAGDVSVADTGVSVTGANDAILAKSVGGAITVGTVGAPITSTIGDATTLNAGIETSNTTGTTTINTAASATINDPNAIFGIEANSTTGGITINSASAIGTGALNGGVNGAGIFASSSGANVTGIAITNTGAIWVDNVTPVGVPASTYGIYGNNTGTGLVTVTNSGVIDPPNFGIFMVGGGNVNVTNTANVTANITAITAKSTGGGTVTVTSNGAAALLTGTTGDGIDAFSAGAGNGSVTVGVSNVSPITSNIVAGVNGVDAEGNGVVGVWTAGTITGTSGIGVIAKSTPGAFAGATVTVSTSGAISDKAGILATTTGTDAGDTVTVTAANNITTTAGNGIEADGVNGLTKVTYLSGKITAVGGDGIRATSSGVGGVTVTTAIGTDIEADSAGKNDITAITTGASGDINVTNNGTLDLIGFAGNDAIFAQVNNATSTSNINVSTVGSPGSNGNVWANNNGIEATTNGLGAITVTDSAGLIDGHGNGIVTSITNAKDASNTTINVSGAGEIFANVVGATDITATTAGTGNIGITVANGETLEVASGGAGSGIVASNTGTAGNITIQTGTGSIGVVGALMGTDGIIATITKAANSGTITVTNAANISMANGADAGIKAVSAGTGTVTINNSGVIDPANYGQFASGAGSVNVNNSGNTTGLTGIHADSSGNAPFTVTVNDTNLATVTGTTFNGIEAFGNGGANVVVNTTAGGTISGGSNGILAEVLGGAGSLTVNTLTGGAVTPILVIGNGGDGIFANDAGTGPVNVTTGNVTGTGAAGNGSIGIVAQSTGGANVTLVTTGNVLGNSTANVQGGGFAGIFADSNLNGSVAVTVNAPSSPGVPTSVVQGGSYGIFASTLGSGTGVVSVTVNANDPVTATGAGTAAVPSLLNGGTGPIGVQASGGAGPLAVGKGTSTTVIANSNITAAGGRAIVTTSGNNASITIASGVTIKGLGDATPAFGGPAADKATHAVVDVTAVTGAVTTISNTGLIESVNGPAIASYGDLALIGTTGGVTVNNNAGGTILGRVQFGGLTKADNLIINNSGTWHTTGLDTLGSTANAETITNKSGGVIGTAANSVATTWAFGTGVNTITNNSGGVIIDGEAPAGGVKSGTPATPAVTTITGTVTFNNNGLLIMGNAGGSTTASDGLIDSVLQAGGGTTLGGTGIIALDANLWSDTQSAAACGANALTAADCLVVAASAGNEGLRVTDTKAHALGAFNPVGIVVVSGATNAGANFHIDSGSTWFNPGGGNQFGGATNVLDKPGLFFYDLAYNTADKTERLIGVPKAAAFEFASVGAATSDLWYTTTQTWFDRQADLRDTVDGKAVGSGPGVWLKMIGDWSERTHNDVFNIFNKTYVFNVTYDQDTAALIGGIDLLNVTHKNEAWVLGVDGGFVDSNINFRASPDRFHLTGANVGGYATYLNGGLFIDGQISANLLDMKVSLPGLQTTPNPWTTADKVNSFGGQVEAGYQMPLGGMLFWEPIGTVAYVNTTFSDLPIPGGTQKLGSDNSFRAALGARVGATADFQYYSVKAALTARVWDEFDNNAISTLIVPGGPNFVNNDNIKGVFGEISGQANLFTHTSGLSAFVNGGVKFKSSYTEGTLTIGARYQF